MQFALLEHTTAKGVHWDLLVERPDRDRLATWRLLENPLENDEVPAEPIGDHRRIYLEYEGPISRGRGWVRRADRGRCDCTARPDGLWRLRLEGQQLRGVYEVAAANGGRTFRRVGDVNLQVVEVR
jgi:hypothetical protein